MLVGLPASCICSMRVVTVGSGSGSLARGAVPCGASEAMPVGRDLAAHRVRERRDVEDSRKPSNFEGRCIALRHARALPASVRLEHRDSELLVEVAIEDLPVPPNRHQVRAHQPGYRGHVEVAHEQLHVLLEFAAAVEEVSEALDRHVREREERREHDPEVLRQLGAVLSLEGCLLGRQERPQRVVHQVEGEAGARDAVAQLVELEEAVDGLVEDAAAALGVDVLFGVAREGRHDPNLVFSKEGSEVLLARLGEHREVAAVDHLLAQPPALFDKVPELIVQLGSAARDVEGVHRGARLHQLYAPLRHLGAHHLFALRGALHVAVVARLVAIQPDVELQDLDGLLLEDHLLPRQELVEARHPQVVKRPPPLLPLLPRQLGLSELSEIFGSEGVLFILLDMLHALRNERTPSAALDILKIASPG
mmetsp:Transcript_9090/g.22419  ORF Transcript_9090/g.22419 Transcript_9090/m.22419 type:complete len:422 (-) Transcript_9090:156-1421(-)